tara:strand:- start:8007 stop:8213 length:207 start_codon:yes stop_codon:yes gene_type:complete
MRIKYSIYKIWKKGFGNKCIKKNIAQLYANTVLQKELLREFKKGVKVLTYKYGDMYETDKYTVWIEEA